MRIREEHAQIVPTFNGRTRKAAEQWLARLDDAGMDIRQLYDDYKVWAFRAAFKLMCNRDHDPVDAFGLAIAWTRDTTKRFRKMSTRELVGFRHWFENIKREPREVQQCDDETTTSL